MNSELKDEYSSNIQKQITRDCSYRCFVSQDESCLETCYDSHILAFNLVAKKLREIGHKRNSRLITLAYGEFIDEWDRIATFNDQEPNFLGQPRFFFEENIYDSNKNK